MEQAGPKGRRLSERGAAAVEMALVLPLLLLVLGGLIDFGRLYFAQVVMTNAAREGARAAIVSTSATRAANVSSRVTAAASPLSVGTPTIALSGGTDCGSPAVAGASVLVTVTVSPATPFSWTILAPVVKMFGPAISAPDISKSATMGC